MKYKLLLLIIIFCATQKLAAQTRYYSLGYSAIPFEGTGATEELLSGKFGVNICTHKFKSNKIMRGFTFAYQKLGKTYENDESYYNYATDNIEYVLIKSEVTVQKFTFGYESIKLLGRKEWDDPGSFYGAFGYYLNYNKISQKDMNNIPSSVNPNYYSYSASDMYYTPVDISLKLGIGYQHMIGKQWMIYADARAYVSLLVTTGYEYNIGVRYRGLGPKH